MRKLVFLKGGQHIGRMAAAGNSWFHQWHWTAGPPGGMHRLNIGLSPLGSDWLARDFLISFEVSSFLFRLSLKGIAGQLSTISRGSGGPWCYRQSQYRPYKDEALWRPVPASKNRKAVPWQDKKSTPNTKQRLVPSGLPSPRFSLHHWNLELQPANARTAPPSSMYVGNS